MLAPNFLSATDLGISDKQRDALIAVLAMLERGELKAVESRFPSMSAVPNGFNMGALMAKEDCGTVGCIAGWAMEAAQDWDLFVNPNFPGSNMSDALRDLFMFGYGRRHPVVSTEQAAHALRNYLNTGKADWDAILA